MPSACPCARGSLPGVLWGPGRVPKALICGREYLGAPPLESVTALRKGSSSPPPPLTAHLSLSPPSPHHRPHACIFVTPWVFCKAALGRVVARFCGCAHAPSPTGGPFPSSESCTTDWPFRAQAAVQPQPPPPPKNLPCTPPHTEKDKLPPAGGCPCFGTHPWPPRLAPHAPNRSILHGSPRVRRECPRRPPPRLQSTPSAPWICTTPCPPHGECALGPGSRGAGACPSHRVSSSRCARAFVARHALGDLATWPPCLGGRGAVHHHAPCPGMPRIQPPRLGCPWRCAGRGPACRLGPQRGGPYYP